MIVHFLVKKNPAVSLTGFFLLLCFLDQLTKRVAENIYKNHFFAFSLPLASWQIYSIYFGVSFFIFLYSWKYYKSFSFLEWFGWIFIVAGAVSNILERIILGYVRDWIYISNGILNFADFYIMIGGLILILYKQANKN